MQGERCQQCGYPKWICHNEGSDIGFKIEMDTCFAMKELDKYEGGKRKRNSKWTPDPGAKAHPVAFTYSKRPLDWALREDHYRAEAEKREALKPDS